MRYIIYKSTDLLDSILLDDAAPCRFVRLTDRQLASPLFNRLIGLARRRGMFMPSLLKLLPGFSSLRRIAPGDVVIAFDMADLTLLRYLQCCVPSACTFHVFFWNPVSRLFGDAPAALSQLRRWGCRLSTFDSQDALQHQMELKEQFVRVFPVPEAMSPIYDYYYLGAQKGREEQLHTLTTLLDSLGLKGLTIVPTQRSEQISYRQNVDYVVQSRCLIELVQPGQTGITLRALEALFYQRKLITNCRAISSLPFYRPENILVWDCQDAAAIQHFLSTPITAVPADIANRYTFNSWLATFV